MYRKAKLVCMDSLNQALLKELSEPYSAFVSPLYHFVDDWEQFRTVMGTIRLRFADNRNDDDMFRRVSRQFQLLSKSCTALC